MSLELTALRTGSTLVLTLDGILDLTSAPRLQSTLMTHLNDPVDRAESIVLDFSGVHYVSSAGLRALVISSKEARKAGRTLVGASLQPAVQKIFEISRFAEVLPCHADVPSAVATLDRPRRTS